MGDGGYFAAGVTLDSFTIRSTDGGTAVPDEQQQRGGSSSSNSFVCGPRPDAIPPLAWMRALAVYLDTDAEDLCSVARAGAAAAAAASTASAASRTARCVRRWRRPRARLRDDGAATMGGLLRRSCSGTRRLRRAGAAAAAAGGVRAGAGERGSAGHAQ